MDSRRSGASVGFPGAPFGNFGIPKAKRASGGH